MKKVIFIFFLTLGIGGIAQAQVLRKLKEKAKTATASSVDRSTDKVVDKAVNKTADNVTDKAINKVSEQLNSLFKKKNKKRTDSVPSAVVDSNKTAIKPKNENK
jgi:glutamyl-tRNA reductase